VSQLCSEAQSCFTYKLIRLLEKYLDDSPHHIGYQGSSDFLEVKGGDPDLLRFCKWEQRVAGGWK
jgi:hypothetical protein